MTTLMGLNFTVIKIDGLPLLRSLEILRGSTFRFFIDFAEGKPKCTEPQNKHSRLLSIKEIRKSSQQMQYTFNDAKINLTNLVHHQMHRMHFVHVQNL